MSCLRLEKKVLKGLTALNRGYTVHGRRSSWPQLNFLSVNFMLLHNLKAQMRKVSVITPGVLMRLMCEDVTESMFSVHFLKHVLIIDRQMTSKWSLNLTLDSKSTRHNNMKTVGVW